MSEEVKYRVEPWECPIPWTSHRVTKYRVKHNENTICTCDSEIDANTIAGLYNSTTPEQRHAARYEYEAGR